MPDDQKQDAGASWDDSSVFRVSPVFANSPPYK